MGVMETKGYSTLPRSPELKPHQKMQFSVILRTLFWGGVLSLCRGCSQCTVNPADKQMHILKHADKNWHIYFIRYNKMFNNCRTNSIEKKSNKQKQNIYTNLFFFVFYFLNSELTRMPNAFCLFA